MLYRMERNNKRYGLLAICEGMGMANATIIESFKTKSLKQQVEGSIK